MSSRFSTWRESCESAITGTDSSLASAFRPWVIIETSCTRLSDLLSPPVTSWR